jgi:hypothetical protein
VTENQRPILFIDMRGQARYGVFVVAASSARALSESRLWDGIPGTTRIFGFVSCVFGGTIRRRVRWAPGRRLMWSARNLPTRLGNVWNDVVNDVSI